MSAFSKSMAAPMQPLNADARATILSYDSSLDAPVCVDLLLQMHRGQAFALGSIRVQQLFVFTVMLCSICWSNCGIDLYLLAS